MILPRTLQRMLLLCATISCSAYVVFLWYFPAYSVSSFSDISLRDAIYNVFASAPKGSENFSTKDSSEAAAVNFSSEHLSAEDAGDPYAFRYILNKPTLCSGPRQRTFVLIVVMTSSTNFAQRNAIRRTWGQPARQRGYKVVFLLARPQLKALQCDIVSEDSHYGDILQADFVDSYRKLTLKSITMVRWATAYCPNASLVLKIDDDMLLNVWGLVSRARELQGLKRTMWGLLYKKPMPHRDPRSKWYVSGSEYPNTSYPDFLGGPAYLVSGDSVSLLARGSCSVPFLHLEDVFLTGIVAEKVGVRRVRDEGILNYWRSFTPCEKPTILTSHGYTPDELSNAWEILVASAGAHNCDDG
ncbi:beta-1,3-galactosyltransferase 5-like [Amblyomma americanum]